MTADGDGLLKLRIVGPPSEWVDVSVMVGKVCLRQVAEVNAAERLKRQISELVPSDRSSG